ncbi:hypothetical protein P692DRAFT_20714900, partial [Suillus brevipes Sb2]
DLRVHMHDHSGSDITPCVNIVSDPNLYLHIISCLVFGNLECLGYDPSIAPTALDAPPIASSSKTDPPRQSSPWQDLEEHQRNFTHTCSFGLEVPRLASRNHSQFLSLNGSRMVIKLKLVHYHFTFDIILTCSIHQMYGPLASLMWQDWYVSFLL